MIKKTDQGKPWDRKKKTSSYLKESIEKFKTFLIVCEGQTEESYFKSFPISTEIEIQYVDMQGRKEWEFLEECKKRVKALEKDGKEYDEIWCVFDLDVNQKGKQFADFDNAIDTAKTKKYNVAYSNDAFELWFCLHYHYSDTPCHRLQYYEQLKQKFGFNYEKTGKEEASCKEHYARLMEDKNASQEKAIAWARKLHEKHEGLPPHQQNPVTLVYLLVESLNKNLRR